MRWEPTDDELRHTPRPHGFTELRRFSWGRALSGISDDTRLPGRYVLIFRDETEESEPLNTWFIFVTPADLRAAEERVTSFGNNDDLQGSGVPAKPRPPYRPAANAVTLG